MAFDGTLKFDTSIVTEGFEAGLDKIGGLAKKGMQLVAGATVAATGAMVALGKGALDAYADYEQLTGGVETLFKTSADIVNEYAANAYKTAGMSANEYMETVTSFSAALISSLDGDTAKAAEVADRAITDMSDNANKMGSSMESIQNAYQGFAKQNYTMLDNLKLGYGGTKSEMERLLADAEAISGIHYDISSYADVVEAIHVVQTELKISGITADEAAELVASGAMTEAEAFELMGTTAKEASTTIQGSVGMTKAAWSNLIVGIADDNADFDKLLNDFVESTATAAENILPRVEVIIGGLGKLVEGMSGVMAQALVGFVDILPDIIAAGVSLVDTLITAIADNADQLTDAALRIGLQFADAITKILPKLVDIGFKALTSFIQGISAHIGDIANMAMQLLSELANTIIDNAPIFIETAAELIAELIEYVADNADIIITKAIDVLMAVAQALLDNAPIIIDALIKALPIILKALIDSLPQILQALATIGVQVLLYIPEIFTQIVQMLPELIGTIIVAIVDAAPQILQAFADLFGGALLALADTWDALMQALDDVIDAIADYFEIGFNFIVDWGKDIVNSAVNTASDFFDGIGRFFSKIPGKIKDTLSDAIHAVIDWGSNVASKMLDIGENIVRGIWDGIKNMSSWLKDKIFGWADDFIDGIKEAFGIHSPSAVMRDSVGKYLAQGVGVGFTEELPDVADDARDMLTSRKMIVGLSEAMPSATSDIINNQYTYNNTVNNSAPGRPESQPIVLNAQFMVGEEVVAEGVVDLVADEIDERQGLKVQLKRKGVTT